MRTERWRRSADVALLVLVVSPARLFASGARDWPISYELRGSGRDEKQ
jgi:hypothetical protein